MVNESIYLCVCVCVCVYLHGHREVVLCLRWEEHINIFLGEGLVAGSWLTHFNYVQLPSLGITHSKAEQCGVFCITFHLYKYIKYWSLEDRR